MEAMINKEDETKVSRLGLRNIHQRLRIMYGEESGLKIKSKKGAGTIITFSAKIGGNNNV